MGGADFSCVRLLATIYCNFAPIKTETIMASISINETSGFFGLDEQRMVPITISATAGNPANATFHRIRLKVTIGSVDYEFSTPVTANATVIFDIDDDFGEYRLQHRGGTGLIANELTGKTGPLVTALTVEDDACIMLVTKSGIMIRIPVNGIRVTGRNAQGVKLIDLEDGDIVVSATPVDPEEQKSEGTPDPEGEGAEAAPAEEPPAGESGEAPVETDAPGE